MSLWKIAWRSMQQRALASCLTSVSMALGVGLVVVVLVIHSVVDRFFRHSSQGYDMIVGAKGGRLQLVLNTVYHLDQPVENLPYRFYKEFLKDGERPGKFASLVDVAVPVCLGDSYDQFRVVGTTPDMFKVWEPYQKYEFAAGRNFEQENFFEGVIGSVVASTTGLKVGSTFQPTHGIEAEGHKHDAFTVVGVLKPSGTPNDRALFINMEGFYLLENHARPVEDEVKAEGHPVGTRQKAEVVDEHDAHHDEEMHDEHADEDHHAVHADDAEHEYEEEHHAAGEHDEHEHADHGDAGHAHGEHEHEHAPLPESQREVTAILVRTSNIMASMDLVKRINKGNVAQAVLPGAVTAVLLEMIVGNMQRLLFALSVLIVIVAGIGIMVSIYNSMSDRRREIAVMRSLGARRSTVLNVILLESILLSLGGGAAGWLFGHGLIALASPFVLAKTGFAMGLVPFSIEEAALLPGLIVLASLVGYVPALAAYRTDVAKTLSAAP
jgi:putative ABC transport system permease protein